MNETFHPDSFPTPQIPISTDPAMCRAVKNGKVVIIHCPEALKNPTRGSPGKKNRKKFTNNAATAWSLIPWAEPVRRGGGDHPAVHEIFLLSVNQTTAANPAPVSHGTRPVPFTILDEIGCKIGILFNCKSAWTSFCRVGLRESHSGTRSNTPPNRGGVVGRGRCQGT